MRRNNRGGNRGGQNWQLSPRSSGPLMTNHLGLQDIDKELELLKRKREIIEQQQQILSNEFCGRNDYEESYNQSSRFDDYVQSFNDRREYNPPNSRKRPIAVWEDDLPSKRFSGQVRPRARPQPLMRQGPFPSGVFQAPRQSTRPLSGPFKPKQPKKDAPKVSKPAAAPNKLKTYPVAERKKLVAEAMDLTEGNELNRLRSDREPSKQLVGRLELALGSIIKEMKAIAEPHVVKSAAVMRDIKMTVRDRIREIMMGQIVGPSDTIKARYREVYDNQSDIEVVANALEAQTGEVTLLKIDDPEKYFKVNMHRIMSFKLKKLLDKLEETNRAEMAKSSGMKTEESAEKTSDESTDADKIPLDESITSTEKFKSLEKWMTMRMTSLIKKFHPYIIKLMDMDTKYSRLKNMITSETVKMLVQKDGQAAGDFDSSDAAMQSVNAELDKPKVNTPRTLYKPMPYFAKLMGKPGLPKRNQMEQFFEPFGAKTIKKHRTVHNLLFVGFTEKENFDKFLAADGTTIGKYVLSIRMSERSKTEQEKNELNASISSEDKLIGAELDEQITDLLTSIRTAEETEGDSESAGKTEGESTAENADANNGTDAIADDNNAGNADENINENADETIADNADETFAENADETFAENADETIADNADETFAENVDETVAENANENITEKTETAETKNAAESAKPAGNGDVPEEKSSEEPKLEDNGLEESADKVQPLDAKPTGRSTPVRASTRLAATPGRIQTRRASKLAQNDA